MLDERAESVATAPDPVVSPAHPAQEAQEAQEAQIEEFAAGLLRALMGMARRSKRRQADLTAVLRGAGMHQVEPARVRTALRLLQSQGCIDNLVPLSDGGLLLSVTTIAVERLGGGARWLPIAGED